MPEAALKRLIIQAATETHTNPSTLRRYPVLTRYKGHPRGSSCGDTLSPCCAPLVPDHSLAPPGLATPVHPPSQPEVSGPVSAPPSVRPPLQSRQPLSRPRRRPQRTGLTHWPPMPAKRSGCGASAGSHAPPSAPLKSLTWHPPPARPPRKLH